MGGNDDFSEGGLGRQETSEGFKVTSQPLCNSRSLRAQLYQLSQHSEVDTVMFVKQLI